MEERNGDWIETFTGIHFYPFDPREEEICIEDIAHALSMQCRFAGHVQEYYSIAEHCCRVSGLCSGDNALWGLLHDGAEAYLGDCISPIKCGSELGRLYCEAEDTCLRAICRRFGLPERMPLEVKVADETMLSTEARDLMKPDMWHDMLRKPLDCHLSPWNHRWAKINFLERFRSLTNAKVVGNGNVGKHQPFEYDPT